MKKIYQGTKKKLVNLLMTKKGINDQKQYFCFIRKQKRRKRLLSSKYRIQIFIGNTYILNYKSS